MNPNSTGCVRYKAGLDVTQASVGTGHRCGSEARSESTQRARNSK
jgi:hypothetical protein